MTWSTPTEQLLIRDPTLRRNTSGGKPGSPSLKRTNRLIRGVVRNGIVRNGGAETGKPEPRKQDFAG